MSEKSRRYRDLAARFTTIVEAVPDERWGAPSPCSEWTAREVLEHLTDTQIEFVGRLGLAEHADLNPDPRLRWAETRQLVQSLLDDPETAGFEYEGAFGRTTFEETIDGFYNLDLLLHGWDLARAAGLPDLEAMPPEEVEAVWSQVSSLGDAVRSPGVFGPPVDPGPSPSRQDELLAFTGRQP